MRTHSPGLQNLFKVKKIQTSRNISTVPQELQLILLSRVLLQYPEKIYPEPISQAQHQGLDMKEAYEVRQI